MNRILGLSGLAVIIIIALLNRCQGKFLEVEDFWGMLPQGNPYSENEELEEGLDRVIDRIDNYGGYPLGLTQEYGWLCLVSSNDKTIYHKDLSISDGVFLWHDGRSYFCLFRLSTISGDEKSYVFKTTSARRLYLAIKAALKAKQKHEIGKNVYVPLWI